MKPPRYKPPPPPKTFTQVPMVTINKLVAALKAVEGYAAMNKPEYLGSIWVCAKEALIECEPEIELIKAQAAAGR